MKKTIINLFLTTTITLLLILPIIHAQNTDITTINKLTEEHIKTRNDLKQYCDHKTDLMIKTVETEGQQFIDENFKVFDKRIHNLAREMLIRFIIALVTGILLSQLLFYIIKRKIEQKKLPRTRTLISDGLRPQEAKLTTTKYEEKHKEKEEPPLFEEPTNTTPPPQIQKELTKQEKKLIKQREKRLKQLIKQQEKIKKKHEKLKRKLKKPQEQEQKIKEEEQKINQEIKKITTNQNGTI